MKPIDINYNRDKIIEFRSDLGMNQAEFARFIGVERQHVRSWERGTTPSVGSLVKIAVALGLTSLDIFFEFFMHYSSEQHRNLHTIHDTRSNEQDEAI